jgi:hypothetical protein
LPTIEMRKIDLHSAGKANMRLINLEES